MSVAACGEAVRPAAPAPARDVAPRCRPNWDGTGFNACTGEGRPAPEPDLAPEPPPPPGVSLVPATVASLVTAECLTGICTDAVFPVVDNRLLAVLTAPPGTVVDVLDTGDLPVRVGDQPVALSIDLGDLIRRAWVIGWPSVFEAVDLELRRPGGEPVTTRVHLHLDDAAFAWLAGIERRAIPFPSDEHARATRDSLMVLFSKEQLAAHAEVRLTGESAATTGELSPIRVLGLARIHDVDLIAVIRMDRTRRAPRALEVKVTVYDRRTGRAVARRTFMSKVSAEDSEVLDDRAIEAWLSSFVEEPAEGVRPDSAPPTLPELVARGGLQPAPVLPPFAELVRRMERAGIHLELDTQGVLGGPGARLLIVSQKGDHGMILHLDGENRGVAVGVGRAIHVDVMHQGESDAARTDQLLGALEPAGVVRHLEDAARVMSAEGWTVLSTTPMVDQPGHRAAILLAHRDKEIARVTVFNWDPSAKDSAVIGLAKGRVLIVDVTPRSRAMFDALTARTARPR